ncbi:hypothetical protein NTCA1_51170 [Novosphingobium sp. TCA1]|nr:hypothetical protein NTCA1_51170 [Novosphingobium sp. TCA1]
MLAHRKCEARIGYDGVRIATVAGMPGELRRITKVFLVAAAIGASAAGVSQPGDADPLSDRKPRNPIAKRIDPADDLMARNDGNMSIGPFPVHDVQVCATDATGEDVHPNLSSARYSIRKFGPHERLTDRIQDHCMHRMPPSI